VTTYPSRRKFLQLSAVAAGAVAVSRMQKYARAAPAARARRVLILNLFGGIRSSAAFFASPETPFNPYGLLPRVTAPFALGRLLGDTPPGTDELGDDAYTLGPAWNGVRVSRLREVTGQFSVLGTFSLARGDHNRARLEEPSGDPDGAAPGLLTRIAAGMSTRAGGADLAIPAFHLMPFGRFGGGDGAFARHVPVSVSSWRALPSSASDDPIADALTGNGFSRPEMIERLDERRVRTRGGLGRQVAATYAVHHKGARAIGKRLASPDFAITDPDRGSAWLGTVTLGASQLPLTNAMLLELFTRCLGPGDQTGNPYYDHAIDLAVSVRLLQLGVPACCTELGNFDFHSGERTGAPALYSFLGRAWATLCWLLPKVADPDGGNLFDHTLLMTTSDFGRDQMGPTGFNGGEGSDHGADYGTSYLAHAVAGAGVRGGRMLGGVDTASYDARAASVKFTMPELLATALDALGLDPTDPEYGFPAERSIGELWA